MSADWPLVSLTELYEIRSGLSKPAKNFGSGFPFLSFKDVFHNFFVPDTLTELVETNERERESCSIQREDVFLTRTSETINELGMSCVALKDYDQATFNGFTKRLRPKSGTTLLPEYVGYYLRSPSFRKEMMAFSTLMSTRASLNNGMLCQLKLLVPPLEEQEKIAQILKTLDNKIQLNHQINQTLEEIAQAIFKSWFVNFEPVKAKSEAKVNGQDQERAAMCVISGKSDTELDQLYPDQLNQLRATAALFPDELVESEQGLISKGWEASNVGNIVKRLKPKKRYTKKQVVKYGSVPVFEQGAAILLGYHNDEPGFNATAEKPLFIFGDHTCVCYLSCTPFDISQNVIPVSGANLPTLWVYYAVKEKQKFQEYRRHWSELIIKKVIKPNIELCHFFSETVTILYQKKEHSIEENNTLSQLRDTLLPKLLSGKIEVVQEA